MPALESLTLTHGARAAISGFESKQPFEARLRHGSLLEGTIGAGRVDFDLMHGSEMVLKGTALTAKLDAQHGSQFLLEGLAIRDAEIHLQHGSKATITARSETDLKAAIYHGSTLNGVIHQGKIGLVAAHGSHVDLERLRPKRDDRWGTFEPVLAGRVGPRNRGGPSRSRVVGDR